MQQATPDKTSFSAQEKLNWLRLIRTENIGPITFYKLIEYYGSASNALDALPELAKKGGRKKPLVAPKMADIEKEYNALQKMGGDIICSAEDAYPLALSATDDAPPVLSYIGNIGLAHSPCLGIVGARSASLNGKNFARKLSQDLGQSGQVIVSGLARGIDTAAHEGALDTGTIAVVAGGIDIVYPQENRQLYDSISKHGLVIAESPLGTEPAARLFPKRNRIVSGLSTGVIVIEASVKSGSLITARMAAEQGRDVYAVPGYPGDPRAAGPNKLIQNGAMLVQKAEDILDNIGNFKSHTLFDVNANPPSDIFTTTEKNTQTDSDEIRKLILENLSQMPVGVDELARTCHLSVASMQIALLEMELAGGLQRLPGNRVVLLD